AGGGSRQFDADDLVALARGFRLPIGWFFTPPPVFEEVTVRTPDSGSHGLPPMLLIDGILGTPDTIPEWEQELRLWSAGPSTMRIYDDGRIEDLGRDVPDVHDRITELLRLRTRVRAGELFADPTTAKDPPQGRAELLSASDDAPTPEQDEPAGGDTPKRKTSR